MWKSIGAASRCIIICWPWNENRKTKQGPSAGLADGLSVTRKSTRCQENECFIFLSCIIFLSPSEMCIRDRNKGSQSIKLDLDNAVEEACELKLYVNDELVETKEIVFEAQEE